jgi:ankyrin repeat protein
MDNPQSEFNIIFYNMAQTGDLEGLENAIESQPNFITKKLMTEAFYKCCLSHKVMGQHENCLNLFLRKKADIDAINRETGLSPLMVCCQKGCSDLVQFLLNNGAYPNVSNRSDKKTALHWAIDTNSGENTNIVSMLLEKTRCNVNQMSSDGYTPLALALDRSRQETIKL